MLVVLVFGGCSLLRSRGEAVKFPEGQYMKREAVVDGTKYGYRVFVPPTASRDHKLPVMLFLHGSDDRGKDNELQIRGLNEFLTRGPQNFPFIVVMPQCEKGKFWDNEMIQQAIASLDQSVREFNGDESHLYLAGFSLGGYGAWHIVTMYPHKFAAVVPMSGRVLPRPGERKLLAPEVAALVDSAHPYEAIAERLRDTPIWIFHGGADPIVPVNTSREMVNALRKVGNQQVNYTEYEGLGHYSIGTAFQEARLFQWLAQQKLIEAQ